MTQKSQEGNDLSSREQQIAHSYAQGESYQQIADKLCIAWHAPCGSLIANI